MSQQLHWVAEGDISPLTNVVQMINLDEFAIEAVKLQKTLRIVLPLNLPPSLGHNMIAANLFATGVLREVTSLLSANQGQTWGSSLVAIQMRTKKVYVLWDLFLVGGVGTFDTEDEIAKVYALTHTWQIGYVIKRARYADKFVENEFQKVRNLSGGGRPWEVDLFAGVVVPELGNLSVELDEVY